MDNTKKPLNVLSLCSGYGGLEIGLRGALGTINILAHVEIEAFAVANLVNKMETGQMVPAPIWTDLKTFDPKPFRDCVDIITGGYPCQPFSAAGKRNGKEDPRHLWPYIRSIIFYVRPRKVFFENVEGHLSLGIGEVLEDLETMGYKVEAGIFSAVAVGAPHQRKRVFILGKRMDDTKGRKSIINSKNIRQINGQSDESGFTSSLRRIKNVPNSKLRCGNSGSESAGRKKRANFNGSSERAELGNSKSNNERGLSESAMHREGIEVGGSSCNVSDSVSNGSGKSDRDHKSKFTDKNGQKWPSRPGQQQFEWEEPRIIRDSTRFANRHKNRIGEVKEFEKSVQSGKTKPKLGRTINGTRNRVDRLRLLGNGVVPQVAEKAYLTLSQKLN